MIDIIIGITITIIPLIAFLYVYMDSHLYAYLAAACMFLIERLAAIGFGIYSNYMIPIELGIFIWCMYYVLRCKNKWVIVVSILSIALWILYRIIVGANGTLGIGALMMTPSIIYWYFNCRAYYHQPNPFKQGEIDV